jgi:hypothetical protein
VLEREKERERERENEKEVEEEEFECELKSTFPCHPGSRTTTKASLKIGKPSHHSTGNVLDTFLLGT